MEAAGWEAGPLGYPVLDEVGTPDQRGSVQGFEIGAMYWTEATGANAVLGKILAKYGELGYETGALGYPKSSEHVIKDDGRFSEFEHGSIYWTHQTGAWPVRGRVFEAWVAEGARTAGSVIRSAMRRRSRVESSRSSSTGPLPSWVMSPRFTRDSVRQVTP